MKLATLGTGGRDGRLAIVSPGHDRVLIPSVPTLQQLLEDWECHADELRVLARRLEQGEGDRVDHRDFVAPLPRCWQWLDGSAFRTHATLMEKAFGTDPLPTDPPLMYQGLSHRLIAPIADVAFRTEAYGIDFEGEFGVVTDAVPMGVDAERARGHIRLVVLINDWSQRAFVPAELKRGFGWMHAKPACSVAPLAVTPDELGDAWRDGRVCLPLTIHYDGTLFGAPDGREMQYGFHELIAYAAQTRDLPAGTIIGSGTVSNADYATVGSACIAERRAIEMIAGGVPRTGFMQFGETIRMEAFAGDGSSVFGAIDQKVVPFQG